MMNIFEKTYAQVQEANRVYEAATTEADKERARAIYHEATDAIEALGGIACKVKVHDLARVKRGIVCVLCRFRACIGAV